MHRYIKLLFIILIFTIALSKSGLASQIETLKYEDKTVSFSYPSNWLVDVQKNKDVEIRLKPKNWSQLDHINDFAIYIYLKTGPFEKIAEEAGFVKKGGEWKLEGRHGIEGDVEEIKGKNWKGLNGEAPVGTGGGLAWATTIIITDGKKSAVLIGEALGTEEGDVILKSIEFLSETH